MRGDRNFFRARVIERMVHKEPALEQGMRERAYEIWNATGREDGHADEHCLSSNYSRAQEGNRLLRIGRQPESHDVPQAQGEPPVRDAIWLIIKTPARTTGCTIPSKRGSSRLALPLETTPATFQIFVSVQARSATPLNSG
jgi:hypothetical protein